MAKIYASRTPEISPREKRNMARARRIAADGMVLLENNGVLPLKADGRVLALFGNGARRTVKGGTGSGDVNSRTVYNVEQGLEDAGFTIGTKKWLDRFDKACDEKMAQYMAHFQAVLAEKGMGGILDALTNPYRDPDVPEIHPEDILGTDRSCAVYVLARTSGEGSDRKAAPGDYELTQREKGNLKTLTEIYDNTIVVLNVGGIIDTKFLRSLKGIGAILLMSQPGNISGLALADVLTGKITPSGHLTATWAENYGDYPCADTFSYRNGDVADEYYHEGIYVGYRYFDSFGVRPAYPFGFGRSYTDFCTTPQDVTIRREEILVTATVQNTGTAYAGRETLQVYVSQPQGELDKPYQVLAGFAKSSVLAPGETETVTIPFPLRLLASYNEGEAAYVLEKGLYYVRLGTHSRNTHIVAALRLGETVVTQQLHNHLLPDCEFSMVYGDPKQFYSYPEEAAEKSSAPVLDLIPAAIPTHIVHSVSEPEILHTEKAAPVTIADIRSGEATLEEMIAQLTVPELAELVVGTARGGFGSASTIGAASNVCPGAAGDTTSCLLESRGIPNLVLADGPAGLRLSRSFAADRQGNIIPGLGESAMGGLEQLFGVTPPERP